MTAKAGDWADVDERGLAHSGAALLVALLGVGLGCTALLPWVRAGIHGMRIYRGTSLPVLVLPVVAGAAAMLVAAIAGGMRSHVGSVRFAGVIGATLAAFIGLQILLVETLNAVIPRGMLPAAVRRLTFGVSAQIGPWLALALAIGGCLAAFRPQSLPGVSELRALSTVRLARSSGAGFSGFRMSPPSLRSICAGGLMLLAVLLVWLRYKPWVTAAAAGQSWSMPGWAIPWAGPWTLIVVLLLIGAVITCSVGHPHLGALVAAGSGWLLTFFAAIGIATVDDLGRVDLDSLAPASARRYTPQIHSTADIWMAFALGLAAACLAAGILLGNPRHAPEALASDWQRLSIPR